MSTRTHACPTTRLLAILTLFLALSTLHAIGDWPAFRGPTGQGLSTATNVPVHWNATENVRWKSSIPGAGWSSPVLAGDRLFLTTAIEDGNSLSLRALCLDPDSGNIVWNHEVFRHPRAGLPRTHSKNSQSSPTPLARGDRLFVHFGHLGTAALNLSGTVLWRQTGIDYPPVHGNGGSPALIDDLLVFSADGGSDPFLVALDANDGRIRWRTPRNTPARSKFSFSTPLVIQIDGATHIISPTSGFVAAYAPDDGREVWRYRYGQGYSVIPRPVFAHGLLFVSSGYDRPSVHAIRAGQARGDITETHLAWQSSRGAPNTPSMLVVGDELYFVSDGGIATCADARTGRVHWNERLGGDFSASPVHAEGRIYFQNESGVGFVVKAGRDFEVLAENDIEERTLASHAVTDGALFIRSASHLWRIGSPAP
ncbi:MAG TPA: PQQ-binding-like beta-propeller repeat protein [Methylomirabilota bacterium]|nr:PQQ-binding-like beta-propeller repeat protein [Methylomirabilota bacterium]